MREAGTDLFRFMALSGRKPQDGSFGSRLQLAKIEPQVKRLRLLLATEAVGCGWFTILRTRRLTSTIVGLWHTQAVGGRAEHVCSARVFQTSTCSAIARASSTSMPRYLTVLSILVCPSKS